MTDKNANYPRWQGHFIEPTIIKDVSDTSVLATEEIFGPVVLLNTFKTEEEALERANNSEFGLYSASLPKIFSVFMFLL